MNSDGETDLFDAVAIVKAEAIQPGWGAISWRPASSPCIREVNHLSGASGAALFS